MKRTLIILSALALASCVNEKHNPEEQGGKFAFTAGFSEEAPAEDRVMTKVFLDHNYYYETLFVLWETGDQVSIYDGQNNGRFVSDRTGLSTSLLLEEGTFNESAKYYALYPYDEGASFDFDQENGVQYVTTTLPATQIARRDAFSSHVAVAACTQEDKNFVFRNVTAVFKANITTDKVASLVFQGNKGEVVAGDIKVSYGDVSYGIVGNSSTKVTVRPEGETFIPGVYYFTILPQTFASGFRVTINMSDGGELVREVAGPVIVPRSSLSIGRAIGTDGAGTQAAPYLIKNKYDLEGLATIVADDTISVNETTYISIEEDIDLQTIDNWKPINNIRDVNYISKLDVEGNGHTISNFAPSTISKGQLVSGETDSGHDQPSLFGIIRGRVQNLTIANAELQASSMSTVGILAGWVGYSGLEKSYVENVTVSGTLSGKKTVGGISGMAINAEFSDCSADVEINASDENVGGFVGRFYENVKFTDCHARGSIAAASSRGVGGLLGFNQVASQERILVTDCSADVDLVGNYQVGGLVGYTQTPMTISGCWARGRVEARTRKRSGVLRTGKHVGGILGVSAGAEVTLSNNYFEGSVSADGAYVGGIQGYNTGTTIISDCHAACTITNTGAYKEANPKSNYDMLGVGGILGGSTGEASVTYCFSDGTISSCAQGTMSAYPTTWSDWAQSVKGETGGYKGGAVGGIIGYTSSQNTLVYHNVSWIASIECERTSIYDAPCAPIVGSISKDNAPTDAALKMEANRYYKHTNGTDVMTISDSCDGYESRHVNLLNTPLDNVVNVIEAKGQQANCYSLFCRPSSSTAGSTARTWEWNTGYWDRDESNPGDKPFLHIRPAPRQSE